jgi:GTP cyclohydrolase I
LRLRIYTKIYSPELHTTLERILRRNSQKNQTPESMRYSIAAVLATFLAGQAVAVSIKHGHQNLHTKKAAQPSAIEVCVKQDTPWI